MELSSFALKFESTSTIQSRALAEFGAEWTPTQDKEIPETALPGKVIAKEWILYFDGAFSLQGTGAGVLLVAPTREHLKYVVQMHFPREQSTNNTAEYEGLLTPDFGTMQNAVKVDSSEKLAGFECLPKTQIEAGSGPTRRRSGKEKL